MHQHGGRRLWRVLGVLTLLLPGLCAAATTVIYPRPEADSDRRSQYPARLLEMALARANLPIAVFAGA